MRNSILQLITLSLVISLGFTSFPPAPYINLALIGKPSPENDVIDNLILAPNTTFVKLAPTRIEASVSNNYNTSYHAYLNCNSPLPPWLKFNSHSLMFNGTTPNQGTYRLCIIEERKYGKFGGITYKIVGQLEIVVKDDKKMAPSTAEKETIYDSAVLSVGNNQTGYVMKMLKLADEKALLLECIGKSGRGRIVGKFLNSQGEILRELVLGHCMLFLGASTQLRNFDIVALPNKKIYMIALQKSPSKYSEIRSWIFSQDDQTIVQSEKFEFWESDEIEPQPRVKLLQTGELLITWIKGDSLVGTIQNLDGKPRGFPFLISKNHVENKFRDIIEFGNSTFFLLKHVFRSTHEILQGLVFSHTAARNKGYLQHDLYTTEDGQIKSFSQALHLSKGNLMILWCVEDSHFNNYAYAFMLGPDGSNAVPQFRLNNDPRLSIRVLKAIELPNQNILVAGLMACLKTFNHFIWFKVFDQSGNVIRTGYYKELGLTVAGENIEMFPLDNERILVAVKTFILGPSEHNRLAFILDNNGDQISPDFNITLDTKSDENLHGVVFRDGNILFAWASRADEIKLTRFTKKPQLPVLRELGIVATKEIYTGKFFDLALPSSLVVTVGSNYTITLEDKNPLPNWLVFNPLNNTLTGVVPFSIKTRNELILRVEVTDIKNKTKAAGSVALVVVPSPKPPMKIPPSPIKEIKSQPEEIRVSWEPVIGQVGKIISFQIPKTKEQLYNLDTLRLKNTISWVSYNNKSRTISGTPRNEGHYLLELSAKNLQNRDAIISLPIIVNPQTKTTLFNIEDNYVILLIVAELMLFVLGFYIWKDTKKSIAKERERHYTLKKRQEKSPNVPEIFLCCLSGEIMVDPWTVSCQDEEASYNYERTIILESMGQNNSNDPISKKPITSLIQNIGLQESIHFFLKNLRVELLKEDSVLRDMVQVWIEKKGEEQLMNDQNLRAIVDKYREACLASNEEKKSN